MYVPVSYLLSKSQRFPNKLLSWIHSLISKWLIWDHICTEIFFDSSDIPCIRYLIFLASFYRITVLQVCHIITRKTRGTCCWKKNTWMFILKVYSVNKSLSTVMPTKSDSDVIFCLQLLRKTFNCTLHLSYRESIDYVCINHILWIGLIHK